MQTKAIPPEAGEQRRRQYLQLLGIEVWQQRPPTLPAGAATTAVQALHGAAGGSHDQAATAAMATDLQVDQTSPKPRGTGRKHQARCAAVGDPSATAAPAQTVATAFSHECLLLCRNEQLDAPLLLDILRHLPPLLAADEDFLHSHLVTQRQLQSLRPRILLSTVAAAAGATTHEPQLHIDLQQLSANPLAAKRQLWQDLQALPWSR
ncbi:MAG: hypothetical protein PF630_01815 [Gammaproteobacteria bacterium]|jgi:DNA polymerase III psi subunit|nr:hypothetical protein [Gammaproteobacteria bacterium]